jgi:NAD-dependent SIR2 family protein deacetylase
VAHIHVGAGMSADSDIATFRPNKPPVVPLPAEEESHVIACALDSRSFGNLMSLIPLEDACYQTKPQSAWFYDAGYREVILQSAPHPGYDLLLQILQHLNKSYFVMTTNIDRYFSKSGFPSELLFETHGSVEALQCSKTGSERCQGVWQWPEATPLPVFDKETLTCDLNTGK